MPTSKPRISINLSESEYAELASLAAHHNLSMAWLGHRAITNLLEQNRTENFQLPLMLTREAQRAGWLEEERPERRASKA
jgi:hypothetical protein